MPVVVTCREGDLGSHVTLWPVIVACCEGDGAYVQLSLSLNAGDGTYSRSSDAR